MTEQLRMPIRPYEELTIEIITKATGDTARALRKRMDHPLNPINIARAKRAMRNAQSS